MDIAQMEEETWIRRHGLSRRSRAFDLLQEPLTDPDRWVLEGLCITDREVRIVTWIVTGRAAEDARVGYVEEIFTLCP